MTFQQFKKVLAFYGRFTASFTQVGYRWRSLAWPRFVPDFQGQRWLVTGGSWGAALAGSSSPSKCRPPERCPDLRNSAGREKI